MEGPGVVVTTLSAQQRWGRGTLSCEHEEEVHLAAEEGLDSAGWGVG